MIQKEQLRITEIFFSLQGETSTVGIPTIFIRLTGCPLRCQYCDTAYAFHGGKLSSIENIIEQISHYQTRFVTVTGGEPLAQKNCLKLLTELCDKNYSVSLETSGAIDIKEVDSRVIKILDIKTPGSKEADKNHWQNLSYLSIHDQIKFVICSRADYEWSRQIINEYNLSSRAHVLFSPSYQQLPAEELANWILQDQLPVRMQIQLHKYLWGDMQGK